MILRNGYVVRKAYTHNERGGRDWFWIKNASNERGYVMGYLTIKNIYFPKDWVGKKIRLKVEVVEE